MTTGNCGSCCDIAALGAPAWVSGWRLARGRPGRAQTSSKRRSPWGREEGGRGATGEEESEAAEGRQKRATCYGRGRWALRFQPRRHSLTPGASLCPRSASNTRRRSSRPSPPLSRPHNFLAAPHFRQLPCPSATRLPAANEARCPFRLNPDATQAVIQSWELTQR